MINLINLRNEAPYDLFSNYYNEALKAGQENIEAIAISSFSKKINEVNSRYVNLKIINEDKFIFFSNYESVKSKEFVTHNQISALIYWNSINVQIRMKGYIKKTSIEFNDNYFSNRSPKKNALAISSNQSKSIKSYELVKSNYNNALNNINLKECPKYWGGYSFSPYYFEFWEGHESRVNKREVFNNIDGIWKHSFLQP